MKRGLVLVEPTDRHCDLLREAGEHAHSVDAGLMLLTVLTEAEYESDAETLDAIGAVENVNYDSRAVLDHTANETEGIGREVLPEGVAVETVAKAADDDDIAATVVETAAEGGCDHVYLLGRRRSPTGKALFGDVAQRVVLDFDGYVTVKTD